MANARIVKEVATIHLELSEDEAQAMADVLQRVGGDPKKSRRKYMDQLRWALEGVGMKGRGQSDVTNNHGAIYFRDSSGE